MNYQVVIIVLLVTHQVNIVESFKTSAREVRVTHLARGFIIYGPELDNLILKY